MFTFIEFVYIFSADDEEADVPTDEMEKLTSSTTTEGEDESFLGFAVFPSKTKVSTELARRMLQKNLERLLLNHTETCRDVISQLVSFANILIYLFIHDDEKKITFSFPNFRLAQ